MAERVLRTRHGPVGTTVAGDGPTVLLLHGFLFSRAMWAPQLAALAGAGFRGVAADLLGFGDTAPAPPGGDVRPAARSPADTSSVNMAPYSGGTSSPIATESMRTRSSSDGSGSATGRPAPQAVTASAAAARISACLSSGRPPVSLSPRPTARVGR